MQGNNNKSKTSTHVRVYREKKNRIEKVCAGMLLKESEKVKETDLIDEILEEGLAKRERKLATA